MKIRQIGELGLIRRMARNVRVDNTVLHGIGDDTAVIRWTRNKHLLFTCDMLIEDLHFKRSEATPYQIGWKAIARNISDIAAMGGLPRYATVSAAVDPGLNVSFLDGIVKGMLSACRKFGVNIVGGDTARSSRIVIDIAMVGEVEKRNLVLRSGAKPGDVILVTGSIGGSIKGKHLNFVPRLKEARELVSGYKVNAMIDISDALLLDLRRLLDSSGVGARLYEGLVPLSSGVSTVESAIREGEDFELLFTMRPGEAKKLFRSGMAKFDTDITLIGEITAKKDGYILVDQDGKKRRVKGAEGFLHF